MFSLPQSASQDMQQALLRKAQPQNPAQAMGSMNPGNSGMAPKMDLGGGGGGDIANALGTPGMASQVAAGAPGPDGLASLPPQASQGGGAMRPMPMSPPMSGPMVGAAQGPPPGAMMGGGPPQSYIGGPGLGGGQPGGPSGPGGGQPNPMMLMALQRALQQKSQQPQPSPMMGAGAQQM